MWGYTRIRGGRIIGNVQLRGVKIPIFPFLPLFYIQTVTRCLATSVASPEGNGLIFLLFMGPSQRIRTAKKSGGEKKRGIYCHIQKRKSVFTSSSYEIFLS